MAQSGILGFFAELKIRVAQPRLAHELSCLSGGSDLIHLQALRCKSTEYKLTGNSHSLVFGSRYMKLMGIHACYAIREISG